MLNKLAKFGVRLSAAALLGLCGAGFAHSADEAPSAPATPVAAEEPKAAAPVVNLKILFSQNCSWCHGGMGMHSDKGPKLAGTKMTENEVRDRIRNGKSGMMPSFKQHLKDFEVDALSSYIKGLKDPDDKH